ncbi:MAG: hypothetical protein CMP11_06335 [Zetaproteobacteria bacterium]|nr:hypothetical protein [Pseudobdellovibrionaceae bacterium]
MPATKKLIRLDFEHFGQTWSMKKNILNNITFEHQNRNFDLFGARFYEQISNIFQEKGRIDKFHSLNRYISYLKECK